jgi:hypothetical protein
MLLYTVIISATSAYFPVLAGSAGEWRGGDQWGGQQRRRGREEKTTQKEIQASRQICKYTIYMKEISEVEGKKSSLNMYSEASCRKGWVGRSKASSPYYPRP